MPTPTLLDDFVDDDGLAKELGRHHRTLKRWRDRGDGPPWIKLGGRILYHLPTIKEWLLSHQQGGSAQLH
jgi:helix-turn-helix protein